MKSKIWQMAHKGLWDNHPGLVQLLGLCPLLAISTSVVHGLTLGLGTLLVITGSSLLVSLLRQQLMPALRLCIFMLLIATLTTCIEWLMQIYTYSLYQSLGIFVPLIASNCLILARAESCASTQPPLVAMLDGFVMGCGFLWLLVLMGALRELLGTGALFAGFEQLLPFATAWRVQLFTTDTPLLLALKPAGAFLLLGLLIAAKNLLDQRRTARAAAVENIVAGSKRVRVTGKV